MFDDWENSCLCLEDGIEPAAANLINLQSIYNECLEGDFIVDDGQVKYCECGCGLVTNINKNSKQPNRFIRGHYWTGKKRSEQDRKKFSDSHKGQYPSKETRKKLSESRIGSRNHNFGTKLSDETKRKLSESHKGKIITKEHRDKISEKLAGHSVSIETMRKISDSNKGKIISDETRLKISDSKKGKHIGVCNPNYGNKASYETRKKQSDARIGIKLSEKTKQRMSESRRLEKHPNWQGGISFEPYCHKFNNQIKEQVRDRFDRKCFLCGAPENVEKHCVHHIDYNKDQGCNNHQWQLVPLCRSCHAKTNNNRNYWETHINNKLELYN